MIYFVTQRRRDVLIIHHNSSVTSNPRWRTITSWIFHSRVTVSHGHEHQENHMVLKNGWICVWKTLSG
ncbi:hypothetical protein LINGRAHAP2_LOCUS24275 [Linum grandiflorum]